MNNFEITPRDQMSATDKAHWLNRRVMLNSTERAVFLGMIYSTHQSRKLGMYVSAPNEDGIWKPWIDACFNYGSTCYSWRIDRSYPSRDAGTQVIDAIAEYLKQNWWSIVNARIG